MKRLIIQTKIFSEVVDNFIKKKQILLKDYEELEKSLVENPKQGDVIPGLSGLRKIRLKSSYSGKRGGFRVDYLDSYSLTSFFFSKKIQLNRTLGCGLPR